MTIDQGSEFVDVRGVNRLGIVGYLRSRLLLDGGSLWDNRMGS